MSNENSALESPREFQRTLVDWFESVAQPYPWRMTTEPWAILISEIMLQQTQVATVLNKNYFTNFLAKYPTPADLAKASESEILSAWEGLGYYRRVRNLQKAAIAICESHGGVFPVSYEEILGLPGVGRYTAGAVASFAYNQPQAIVDANVARIFSRIFNYQERVDSGVGMRQLWQWAEQLVDEGNPRSYNSALMELGQQICTNKAPKCDDCVICRYCSTGDPESLPIKKSARKRVLVDEFALFVVDSENRILLQQESDENRRAGMWKLPLRGEEAIGDLPLLLKSSYGITHHKVTLRVYRAQPDKLLESVKPSGLVEQWYPLKEVEKLPMPSPFRKALNALLEDYI